MSETVVDINALLDILLKLIPTKKVRIKEADGIIQIVPVNEVIDCTIGLRGILSDYDIMSVNNFLERKRVDKEMDL